MATIKVPTTGTKMFERIFNLNKEIEILRLHAQMMKVNDPKEYDKFLAANRSFHEASNADTHKEVEVMALPSDTVKRINKGSFASRVMQGVLEALHSHSMSTRELRTVVSVPAKKSQYFSCILSKMKKEGQINKVEGGWELA